MPIRAMSSNTLQRLSYHLDTCFGTCWGESATPPRSRNHNVRGFKTGGREGLKSGLRFEVHGESAGEDSGAPSTRAGWSGTIENSDDKESGLRIPCVVIYY
jgi:hypothetical protein